MDALVASSQSDAAFWLLVASVGLIAALFGLKLVFSQRRETRWRRSRD
jgi:hypothetical protein